MPIIDPSLQYFLLINDSTQSNNDDGYSFFLKYLRFAAHYINKKGSTIKAAIQFKRDLIDSIQLINDEFGCNFKKENDYEFQNNNNFYQYLFDKINRPNKLKESKRYIGTYKIGNDSFHTKFYQPHVLFSEFHSWYFSDTPIAILCVNSEKFQLISDEFTKQKIFQLIKLEIDLMAACDLTLVLCYNGFTGTENLLFKIIKDDQFAELHIDIFEQTFMHNFLVFMNENFLNCKHLLKGFIYLYSYFQKIKEDIDLLKKFKQILCTQTISFSMDPKEALKKVSFVQTKPFAHCKTGFDQYLRIFLCYTPIFNKSKPFDNPEMQPTEISDLCVGYIDSTQYFFKTGSKINIFFGYGKFENKNYDISFEDIHLLRPDLFVNDTLSLIPIDKDIHESIANVLQKVKNKFTEDEKSQKKYIHSTNFKNLIQIIRRVAYAYTYFKRNIDKKMDFTIRKTQIYAVIEACQSFLLKNKETKSENSKGIVYQIKTGEGKSCIIAMIAAVLAIKNITVHIVSSNIKLSNRDFLETFDFFKLFKLKSAILLHQNELPFSSNTIDSINNDYFDSMNNNEDIKAKYSDQFYHNDLFQNQLKMNFSVCGFDFNGNASNKADIVYSTFVNFECFFLHLMENCPAYIEEYYPKCGLLMDEVDSILIDEITNGTIISKEMKSNAKKILSLVYKYKRAEYKVDKTFELIKKLPKTEDIEIKDIEQMYKEIDIVNSKKFSRNYMIDSYTVKNKNRIKNLMANLVKTIIETKNNIQSLNVFPSSYGNHASKKPRKPLITSPYESLKNSEDFNCEEDEEDEEDEEEEELNTDKFKVFKYIVPFDYNNKGIIEKNKEFSGFIPQFISLKEGDKDESIVFKDISISYLYVSHPIYAKLYGHICGFTGTVGSNDDKKIFSKQYELTTKKVSRYKPNLRVELPIFTCQSTKERDIAIANEIAYFHEKGNPVLAIFQDIEEIKEIIYTVYRTVRDNFVINIFDGSNDSIEPDYIGGVKGAITLGTNFCGRGTDIKCSSSYPLHVIVSYYTKNVRVMEQAFGRTARNGQVGTCRCICVENKIFKSIASFSEKIEKSINESDINARYQKEFINYYKKKRSWIFDIIVDKQSFTKSNQIDLLKTLRDSRINVNRIVAYKYQFPICMSIDRFLDIQSQKIFSIFNCPNCKYSWKIFQRYIRVMILQSWSLMINKFDQEKYSPDVYEKKLINRINELHKKLDEYLPDQPEYLEMIPTFVYICHKVINRYYDSETKYFKFNSKGEAKQIYFFEKLYKIFGKSTSSIFAQIGFKPFSLLSKSGARIAYDNVDKTNFIKDPELSYEKQLPNNKFTLLSITERIDDLFNIIFQQMSSILGDKLFLKFFLRRTLAGCEFGICLNIKFSSNEIDNSDYLLIDKEPLFFATIYLWSIFPVLAGVLICVIIYLIGVAKKIYQNMTVGPVEPIQKKLVKAIKCVSKELIEAIYEKIIDYLKNILKKQIEKLRKICDYEADFFDNLVDVLVENDIYGKVDEFADEIGLSISAPSFLGDFGEDVFDGSAAFKISVLLILLFSCFIRVCFINKKEKIKNETVSDAKEYDSSFDKEKSSNKDPKVVEIETEETKKQINKASKSQKAKDSNDKESRKSTNQDKKAKELENEKDEKQANKASKSEKALDSIVKKRKKSYEVDGNIDFSTEKKEMKRVNELIMKSKIYELLTNNELNHFYISHIESSAIPNEKVDLCFVRTKKKICKKVEVPIFVGNGLENVSNELYEKVFFFASKIKMKEEHPVLIPFVGFTLNSQKSYLMFDTLINDHRYSNFIDAYNREKLNSPIDFAYGISCAMEYIQKNKLFNNDNFPNLTPYNILLIDDAYPLIFPMDFKSNIIKNLKDFPELIPPELEKNPDDFSIQSCAFMFGKIALLMNATFNKSNTTEILNSCVSSDPHLRPTFSQICDSYENENMKRDRFRNHKVSYYFKKLMSIRKQ